MYAWNFHYQTISWFISSNLNTHIHLYIVNLKIQCNFKTVTWSLFFPTLLFLHFFYFRLRLTHVTPFSSFLTQKKETKKINTQKIKDIKIKDILVINKIKFFLNTSQFPRVIFFWSNRFPRLVGHHAPPRPFIITVRHIYTCILKTTNKEVRLSFNTKNQYIPSTIPVHA